MNDEQLLAALERIDDRLDELRAGTSRAELVATIQRHADNADAYVDELSLSALEALADEVSPTRGVYAGQAGGAASSGETYQMGASLEDLDAGD